MQLHRYPMDNQTCYIELGSCELWIASFIAWDAYHLQSRISWYRDFYPQNIAAPDFFPKSIPPDIPQLISYAVRRQW